MKTGTPVRLTPPPIDGVVVERRINPQTDELECLVEWTENGEAVRRWFDADQLTQTPEVQP